MDDKVDRPKKHYNAMSAQVYLEDKLDEDPPGVSEHFLPPEKQHLSSRPGGIAES